MSAKSKPHDEYSFVTFMHLGLAVAVLLLAISSPVYAESSGRHSSEVSLGASRADGNTEIALGIEYEYALTERWGIGAVLEHTPEADDYYGNSLALAMLHLHPTPAYSLSAGTGIERVHGVNGRDQHMLFLGIGRLFQAGRFFITPSLSLEIINGETTKIFDISFAMNFRKTSSLGISLARESS